MAETNGHARGAATDEGREALAKYRVLVEHLPAIVYTSEIGTEGEWLYVSPKIEDILGWTPEEWMAHESPWKHRCIPTISSGRSRRSSPPRASAPRTTS